LLAGNDDQVVVGVTTDPESRTVSGTTLGDHQLVGQRRWSVSVTPIDGCSVRVTIKTEAYERPRSWANWYGFQIAGAQDMTAIWEAYLLNIQDWANGNYNMTSPGRPNSEVDYPGYVPNPWGPPNQYVPPKPPDYQYGDAPQF
jgi:hypothetical protein